MRVELDRTDLLEAFEALWMVARRIDLSVSAHAMAIPIDVASWGALHEQLEKLVPAYQLVRAELHQAEDIPEVTAEDLEHSLTSADRSRMIRGEFEPSDIEKLRKWCRLSREEMAQALNLPMDWYNYWQLEKLTVHNPLKPLLRIAARNPGAFRALVNLPLSSPEKPSTP